MTNHNEPGTYDTADELFDDRRGWLSVHVVEIEPNCFDIMLKLDGTYFDRETAVEVAESFARDVAHLLRDPEPPEASPRGAA